ncbi:MAG: acyl-ACP--UDP-N-acetylglucosamine O-acyltransferase [Trueperaceae bacterium]|nr:acyl-ACP--UDP-N-acetylglucosamine O-acyltransferase [Trueperaceae bacterium]
MAQVHASAVVDRSARLAADVQVGPHAVIEADVVVGPGTVLLPGTVLSSGSRVGARCRLGPYATVGGLPMDRDFAGEVSFAVLEDEVELRDFSSVHRATGAGAETRIGAGSLVMSYAHVTHNVQVGRGAVLTNLVQLGGHVRVGDRAVLGAGTMVHQFAQVGAYAMVGGMSGVNRDVLPYALARGNFAEHYRVNAVGLRRNGIEGERYHAIEQALRALRRGDDERFVQLAADWPEVDLMRTFRDASRRGLARFRGGS